MKPRKDSELYERKEKSFICGSHRRGKVLFFYDKGGKVAAAYEQFGKEVTELGEKQRKQNRADRIR